jgi:hypothetical protein
MYWVDHLMVKCARGCIPRVHGKILRTCILASAICGLCLAPTFAGAQSGKRIGPVPPGGVRIITRVPETGKWDASSGANGTRVFLCKALACPDREIVTITISKTLARHPDPKALEKYAKIDLPKQQRAAAAAAQVLSDDKITYETIASKTAKLKGYPAIINESKIVTAKATTYLHVAIIFSGPVMVRVSSRSVNRELARKSLHEFVEAMAIVEGPARRHQGPVGPAGAGTSRSL